ncbi:MAG: cytochrome-c peroxidase [Nitrospira sp.]|nr:cytochrome-c peroxidase [Nitrospira sp.]
MGKMRIKWVVGTVVVATVGVIGLAATMVMGEPSVPQPAAGTAVQEVPLGLEDPKGYIPADNPQTARKIELGRWLFFDKRLSKNGTIACANCHMPSLAFTDGQAVSTGINRLQGGRSAPTAINRVYSKSQFWDGRADTLEDQSIGPFVSPVEHGFTDHNELVARIKQIDGYRALFQEVCGREVTAVDVGRAIASFQRTLLSGNSPADRFDMGGDETALSASAQRGLELFRGKARCTRCHSGFNFSDEKYHNLGIGWDTNTVDLGRYMVTKNPEDIGAFKTPTLREISRSAPYMHDGRFATLEDVVRFYNQGGIKNLHLDNTVIPLELTEPEQQDLVAFLRALNGEGWQHVAAPVAFPK